jgi:hypothetical protein
VSKNLLLNLLWIGFVFFLWYRSSRCTVCGTRNWRTLTMAAMNRGPRYCSDKCELDDEFSKLPHVRKDGGILLDPTHEVMQHREDAELRRLGF